MCVMTLLLSFDPYSKTGFAICRICKSSVHQSGSHYCQGCAYKKGTSGTRDTCTLTRKPLWWTLTRPWNSRTRAKSGHVGRMRASLFPFCALQESVQCVGRRFWTPRTTNKHLCKGGHEDGWTHVQECLLCWTDKAAPTQLSPVCMFVIFALNSSVRK